MGSFNVSMCLKERKNDDLVRQVSADPTTYHFLNAVFIIYIVHIALVVLDYILRNMHKIYVNRNTTCEISQICELTHTKHHSVCVAFCILCCNSFNVIRIVLRIFILMK
jgi:hypothetical protein